MDSGECAHVLHAVVLGSSDVWLSAHTAGTSMFATVSVKYFCRIGIEQEEPPRRIGVWRYSAGKMLQGFSLAVEQKSQKTMLNPKTNSVKSE